MNSKLPIFKTFKLKVDGKIRNFIELPRDSGVSIFDELGNNYGGWFCRQSFLSNWKKQDVADRSPIGTVKLSFQCLS